MMKSNLKLAAVAALALALLAPLAPPNAAARQTGQKEEKSKQTNDARRPVRTDAGERLEPDDSTIARPDVPERTRANRREQINEDAEAELFSYNNFLSTYRLGPEDVISVNVFGLDRYSKSGITVPPDGTIDYYFVKDGLFVVGKTTRQVAEEITQHLDEYIIEPKVTVTLERAMSQRYGVVGDVGKPGVYVMSRRLSVYEALSEAGGVLSTGDKKKVIVLHWNADRTMQQIPIDIAAIEKGRAPDNYFLRPGDQIFVPGNKWKKLNQVLSYLPIISFARIFTGGW